LTNPHFQNWLDGLSLIARFKTSRGLCSSALDWLWYQREKDGLWDFGHESRQQLTFPLSESWHDPMDRKIDCSISVLHTMAIWLSAE
jgi:hypothetical protein